ncbi:MAG: hypothetical protein QNJ03_00200, partial [Dinoroseobacter sp.]|nr:hypothetical protein [Dinoroseobacter sp.]
MNVALLRWHGLHAALLLVAGLAAPSILIAEGSDQLDSYTLEQFGAPPAIPDTPLSQLQKDAV